MSLNTNTIPSIHGRRFGLSSDGHLVMDGRVRVAGHRDLGARARLFDHFTGPAINSGLWGVAHGSDGSAADFAIAAAVGGKVRGTTGAGGTTTMAVNGVQLHSALNWQANKGGLIFSAAVAATLVTSLALYVGFTDQVAALEMPFTLSSGTLTSNATDACGFLFDTGATASTVKCVGVANDVDAAVIDTAVALTAATYALFNIEVDASGNATFWLNGTKYGTLASAVTPTIPLTPVVAGFRRTGTLTTIDVDHIAVEQDR